MFTCFFTGHCDAPGSIQEQLNETVAYLVKEHHVTDFIVGHYGNFDRMATIAVQRAVRCFPERGLTAELLEPYFPGERKLTVPLYFDGIYYPKGMENVPERFCIEKANRKALEQASWLVAYVCREGGNAAKLLRTAKRWEKQGAMTVINLGKL